MRPSRGLAVCCGLVALAGVVGAAQNHRDRHNTGPERFSERVVASGDGRAATGEPVEYFKTSNRCRDMAFSPDGRHIFLSTDDHGATQDGAGNRAASLDNPGAMLEFTYSPAK